MLVSSSHQYVNRFVQLHACLAVLVAVDMTQVEAGRRAGTKSLPWISDPLLNLNRLWASTCAGLADFSALDCSSSVAFA